MPDVLPPFPTDPQTIDLLDAAVRPHGSAERTSLNDLCVLMSELAGVPLEDGDGIRIEYHANDVIAALIDEVRALRTGTEGVAGA